MFGKKKEEEKKPETPAEETKPAADEIAAEAAEKAPAASDDAKLASDSSQAGEAKAAGEPEKPVESEKPKEPDWKTLYAVTLADFDNYKKRAARDREDVYRYAESDILKDVLPTVDNLALALANVKAEEKGSSFVTGVQLVSDTLLKSLKDHGAEPFDCVGSDLDTERMEAIATLPSTDVAEGKVSNEVKRGWMLKGKILRVAQVVVSSGKPAEAK